MRTRLTVTGLLARAACVVACAVPVAAVAAGAAPAAWADGTYGINICENGYGGNPFGAIVSNAAGDFSSQFNCYQPSGSNPTAWGDGLFLASSAPLPYTNLAEYSMDAPGDTTFARFSYSGAFSAWDGWLAMWVAYGGPGHDQNRWSPGGGVNCTYTNCFTIDSNTYGLPAGTNTLQVGVFCLDASTCPYQSIWSPTPYDVAASIDIWQAQIVVDEPNPPNVRIDGIPQNWVGGNDADQTITASAQDPAGVCSLGLSSGGGPSTSTSVPADYGSLTPCGGDASVGLALDQCQPGGLGTGIYTPSASATDPAELTGSSPGNAIRVECQGPQLSVTANEDLSRWYASPQSFTVSASDGYSGVASASCTGQQAGSVDLSQPSSTLTVTQNGQTDVSCSATNVVRYTTTASLPDTIKIDDQVPAVTFGGSAAAPAWVSGPQTVTAAGSESQQLSGIASVSCQLDGSGWTTTQGSLASVRLNSDGVHTVSCYSTTRAGLSSPTETHTVQIDSTPPTISFSNGPSQSTWSTTAQSIDVTAAKPQGTSGVAEISCTLNQQTNVYADTGNPDSQTVKITVQPLGGDLSCKALDNAGNWSAAQAWSFLIDNTLPTGEFLPPDPSNPTQVAVLVADSESGVAGAQIEIQTADGWRQLPTSYDASTGIATATIPDDGSLTDGTYNLEALVWSVAGNEATITQGTAAGPAEITLPLRIVTELLVGQAQASIASCNLQREVLPRADRERHRALAARLVRRCGAIEVPHESMTLLRYGQRATIHGLLETVDGTALPGQAITIAQQATGWGMQAVGSLTTDSQGRFTDTLSAGASRTVTFSYRGTEVLRSTSATTGVRVIGKGTIDVGKHAVAGHKLRISGRLYGGYIPPDGVLVQLWYRVKGVPASFGPFNSAIHTNRSGAWSVTFPVSTGARGYTYLFKAVIAKQTGWPFLATSTNVIERFVS
jgi:hypothetical protein